MCVHCVRDMLRQRIMRVTLLLHVLNHRQSLSSNCGTHLLSNRLKQLSHSLESLRINPWAIDYALIAALTMRINYSVHAIHYHGDHE